jgi:hypothetical protein
MKCFEIDYCFFNKSVSYNNNYFVMLGPERYWCYQKLDNYWGAVFCWKICIVRRQTNIHCLPNEKRCRMIIVRLCTLYSAGKGILTERGRLSKVDKSSLVGKVRGNHPKDPGLASQLRQTFKKFQSKVESLWLRGKGRENKWKRSRVCSSTWANFKNVWYFNAIGFFFRRSNNSQKVQFNTDLLKQRHRYLYRKL